MKTASTIVSLILICLFINNADAQETPARFKNAFRSEQFQLLGYGQLIANFSQFPQRGQVKTTANSSIDLARVIMFATGRLGDKQQFGYMLMCDLGPNTSLQELYGDWMPSTAVNVRLGQYKIPFTIENPMSASRMETIYPSRSVMAMAGGSGDFNQYGRAGAIAGKSGRDAGLTVLGKAFDINDLPLLEYYAGLFNGTGINTKDNNNGKDFIGTAYLQPLKGLKIGGSVYLGEITLTDSISPAFTAGTYDRTGWAASLLFDSRQFYLRSEYIANRTGELDRSGFYASGIWRIVPDKWEAIAKFDKFCSDRTTTTAETVDYTLGINYCFAYLSKIMLNYIYTDDASAGRNHAAAIQLQIYF